MSNNLTYGGIIYPDSSFVFDKIYNSFQEAKDSVETDTVLVGRYILVAYCDTAFTKDERSEIEGNWSTIQATASEEQKAYRENYELDGHNSNDRKVYRKSFNGTTYTYNEIASLHTDLSNDSIAVLGIQNGDKVLAVDQDRTLSSTLNLVYDDQGGNIKLLGIDNVEIASISTTDFIADGVFQRIEIDDQNNTLTFYWTNYDIENNTTEEKSQTVNLYDIIDPYISGNGITVTSIPNENPTIAIKLHAETEPFLTVGANGLKLSGVQTAIDTAKDNAIQATKNTVKIVTSENDKSRGTNVGDICIVKSLIDNNDHYSYTAYIWQTNIGTDRAHWEAMDGNYNADNVYFAKDLITSFAIGQYSLTDGMATIPAAGKNLSEVWQSIYVKELKTDLAKTAPSCTMSGNNIKYYLVGATSEEQTITLGLNKGAYTYGYGYVSSKDEEDPVAGTPAQTRVSNDGTGVVTVDTTPYTLVWDGEEIEPMEENGNVFKCTGITKDTAPVQAQVKGKVQYKNAGNPVSNLGNIYPAQAYEDNTSEENIQTLARWYYPIYQGFTYEGNTDVGAVITDHANITATQLQTKLSAPVSGSTSTSAVIIGETAYKQTKLTKAIASGAWRQYYLAYPKDYSFDMSAAKDSNNIDCTVRQAADVTLTFNGIDVVYAVYYINNATPYGTKTITWTLN